MHKLYVFVLFFCTTMASLLVAQPLYALGSNIVISQVQFGTETAASNEIVELYNNSPSDVEITDWCLYYASASSTLVGSKKACFVTENVNIHLFLPGHSFALAISNQLSTAVTTVGSDLKFSATLSDTAGHVRLIDSIGNEIDKVGWGATAVSAEGLKPITTAPDGKVLSRKTTNAGILQDTDVNADDFEIVAPRTVYSYGSIYEVQDICANIGGTQTTAPEGYSTDTSGNCNPPPVDVCGNLEGLQTVVPDGYFIDDGDLCRPDVCPNLDGIQKVITDGYKLNGEGECMLDVLPLEITELLPNPVGSDAGNEFIEIFNPNISDEKLDDYFFRVGSSDTDYVFPTGSTIGAGKYTAFFNGYIHFSLVNTTSKVALWSTDGQIIDESPSYINPNDGMAWALIGGVWQYTDQPTPGSANITSMVETVVEYLSPGGLEPCAVNQYRSPETNRCRLISASVSTLALCKDGQYRSEETNRCRSIATDAGTLAPCGAGEERNLDTNRCRSTATVLGASTLALCKAGQERNPDTNRCRNVASAIPVADYAPEQSNESSSNYILWWSLGGVGAVAVGYGVWEWRHEISGLLRKSGESIASK